VAEGCFITPNTSIYTNPILLVYKKQFYLQNKIVEVEIYSYKTVITLTTMSLHTSRKSTIAGYQLQDAIFIHTLMNKLRGAEAFLRSQQLLSHTCIRQVTNYHLLKRKLKEGFIIGC
jgi:hypothetical protein